MPRFLFGRQGDVYYIGGSDILPPPLERAREKDAIEAMASGLPVIASRVGGIPDMVTDGESGLLIAPTPQALADAIERLAKDEALRQHLGAQGIQSAQRFSLPAMAQGYLDLYEALLQGERL